MAHGIGEQAIVTDPVKAAGQNVQQEAAHELVGNERHGFMTGLALGPLIFPAEGNTALVQGDESRVGYRHPVGITRQIS